MHSYPRAVGGDERDLWDYCDGVRTVTAACPSTGWVTGVLNVHQTAIHYFDKSVRDAVWSTGPDTIICSSGTPSIKAKLVDGGVIVNGRGRWSSGCDHAEWAVVGLKVPDAADVSFTGRTFRPYQFMAHRSEYTIEDTWHAEAMRGSGSNDLIFDNLFVASHRLEGLDALTFGYARGSGVGRQLDQPCPVPDHLLELSAIHRVGMRRRHGARVHQSPAWCARTRTPARLAS